MIQQIGNIYASLDRAMSRLEKKIDGMRGPGVTNLRNSLTIHRQPRPADPPPPESIPFLFYGPYENGFAPSRKYGSYQTSTAIRLDGSEGVAADIPFGEFDPTVSDTLATGRLFRFAFAHGLEGVTVANLAEDGQETWALHSDAFGVDPLFGFIGKVIGTDTDSGFPLVFAWFVPIFECETSAPAATVPEDRGIIYRVPRASPGDVGYAAHTRCPQKWVMTGSGITLDTACLIAGVNSRRITAGDINVSETIERDPADASCFWEYIENPATSVTMTNYVGAGCGGAGTPATSTITFSAQYFDTTGWRIRIAGHGGTFFRFDGGTAGQRTFANEILIAGSAGGGVAGDLGYLGTITLDECPT